ncbi:unnamed protein product [Sympodiomycopsis kandeliae]
MTTSTSPIEPSKAPSSCNECRARKRKCDRTWPCQNCVSHARSCMYSGPGRRGPPQGWTTTCLTRALEAEAALTTVLSLPGVFEMVQQSIRTQGNAPLEVQAGQDARSLEEQWRTTPLNTLEDVAALVKERPQIHVHDHSHSHSHSQSYNGITDSVSSSSHTNIQRGRSLPRSSNSTTHPNNDRPSPPRRFQSARDMDQPNQSSSSSLADLAAYATSENREHDGKRPQSVRTTSTTSTTTDTFYQGEHTVNEAAEDWEQDFW